MNVLQRLFWKNSRISIRDAWHLFIYIYHLNTGEKKDGGGGWGNTQSHNYLSTADAN